MQLGEQMESYGLRNVPLPPWEFLTTYRNIASGAIPEKGQPVLRAANNMHNRLLFSIGVALSLLLAALQAILLLIPDYWRAGVTLLQEGRFVSFAFPDSRMTVLLAAGLASFALRWVAGHLWERELYLTTSLTNFDAAKQRSGLFDCG